jgi:hypothetical protein
MGCGGPAASGRSTSPAPPAAFTAAISDPSSDPPHAMMLDEVVGARGAASLLAPPGPLYEAKGRRQEK